MTKFFMPQSKPKKKTDYRIIIYKQLLTMAKSIHLKYISQVIKNIKKSHQQQTQSIQLQQQLNQLKLIKKKQLKQMVQFIMIQYLKINNLDIISKITKINKTNLQIINEINQTAYLNNFIKIIIQSSMYQLKQQQFKSFVLNITNKKKNCKIKSKSRKIHKLKLRAQRNTINYVQNKQQLDNNNQQLPQNKIINDKIQEISNQNYPKQTNIKIIQQEQPNNSKNFWEKVNARSQKSQYKNQQQFQQISKQKQKISQRTQFIKKGRNKTMQRKKQRKHQFTKKYELKHAKQNKNNQQKQIKDKFIHPSWLAKLEQKKQTTIVPFSGKKIIF